VSSEDAFQRQGRDRQVPSEDAFQRDGRDRQVPSEDAFQRDGRDRLVDPDVLGALRQFRVPGEQDPVQQVVDVFVEVTPGRLNELLQAAARRDQQAVREIAHTLKGSAGMVGANAMRALAAEVEQFADRGGEESIARVRRLAEMFARTKPALVSLVHGGI
jgi:HPt (histidine-containing phosphotransfer) domain-containing protein